MADNGGERVRICLVGLGFGRAWVPAYQGLPGVDHVGICEINSELLARVGDEFGVKGRHSSLEEVLASDEYNAVHLLTPIPLHAEQSLAALRAGKHCACAIPMAMTLDEARAILEAERESGKRYMLMETELYSRAFLYARKLLAEGTFGELQLLRGVHFQNMEGWPDYWKGFPPMLYSLHGLGPILHAAGRAVRSVVCLGSGHLDGDIRGTYDNPFPVESALMRLEGSDVVCEVSCCQFKMVRPWMRDRFFIYGDRMSMESAQTPDLEPVLFEAETGPLSDGQRGRKAKTRRIEMPPMAELVDPAIADHVRRETRTDRGPCAYEFVASITQGRPSEIDAARAAHWTAVCTSAHESALRGGEAVPVPAV